MSYQQSIFIIIGAAISGIVGVLLNIYRERRETKRKKKMARDTLLADLEQLEIRMLKLAEAQEEQKAPAFYYGRIYHRGMLGKCHFLYLHNNLNRETFESARKIFTDLENRDEIMQQAIKARSRGNKETSSELMFLYWKMFEENSNSDLEKIRSIKSQLKNCRGAIMVGSSW